MNTATSTATSTDREIILSRTFDAPRALVFEMYTTPKHLEKWWGPNGFTITIDEMNVKPGGIWKFMMHAPDGKNWPNLIEYVEVVQPERLVFHHGSFDQPKQFYVTVTFDDENGKTKVTQKMVFPTAEACNAVKSFGAIELGKQGHEKLARYLTTLSEAVSS